MNTNIDQLLSIIERELGVSAHTLTPDTRLADIADSLDWVNLISAMEDAFGLRIGFEEGLRLHTLQDLMHRVAEPQLVAA